MSPTVLQTEHGLLCEVLRGPCTEPLQTPAVLPPLPPRRFLKAGRPGPTHGGSEMYSDGPRTRRVPPGDPVAWSEPVAAAHRRYEVAKLIGTGAPSGRAVRRGCVRVLVRRCPA